MLLGLGSRAKVSGARVEALGVLVTKVYIVHSSVRKASGFGV